MRGICIQKIRAISQFGAEKITFPPNPDRQTYRHTDIHTYRRTDISFYRVALLLKINLIMIIEFLRLFRFLIPSINFFSKLKQLQKIFLWNLKRILDDHDKKYFKLYLKVQRIWNGYIRQRNLQHFSSATAVIRRFSVIWRLSIIWRLCVVRWFRSGCIIGWFGCRCIVRRLGGGWVVRGFGCRWFVWRGGCIVGRFGGWGAVSASSSATTS